MRMDIRTTTAAILHKFVLAVGGHLAMEAANERYETNQS